ncbi:hypothetical protein ISS07_05625 [Candidatus Woesearchaeota archaeon]|nr:hypothetical protein [Candidatus Woesearchaeota archaeon]
MGYGMMHGNWSMIYHLVCFVVASFVFSVIFWMTHNWLVDKKIKKRK